MERKRLQLKASGEPMSVAGFVCAPRGGVLRQTQGGCAPAARDSTTARFTTVLPRCKHSAAHCALLSTAVAAAFTVAAATAGCRCAIAAPCSSHALEQAPAPRHLPLPHTVHARRQILLKSVNVGVIGALFTWGAVERPATLGINDYVSSVGGLCLC